MEIYQAYTPRKSAFYIIFPWRYCDTTVERIKHKMNEIRFEEFEISGYKKIGSFHHTNYQKLFGLV